MQLSFFFFFFFLLTLKRGRVLASVRLNRLSRKYLSRV